MESSKIPVPSDTINSKNNFDREETLNVVKRHINIALNEDYFIEMNKKVEELTIQGELVKLLILEKQNVNCQSLLNNMQKGVIESALKIVSNTLPTPYNLKVWKKSKSSKCDFCGNTENLQHILSYCNTSLTQGRFT